MVPKNKELKWPQKIDLIKPVSNETDKPVIIKKGNLKYGGNIEIDDEYLDKIVHNINL